MFLLLALLYMSRMPDEPGLAGRQLPVEIDR
jgi:hypothetical protein